MLAHQMIAAARPEPGGSGVEARRGPIIALFAIRNTSPEPQDAYFTDGLSEQLVSGLLRFENLRVISPEGVKPYDEAINTVKNLRTKLGVDYVLRGNARRIDDKLRLALELADTKTDQVVWAETLLQKLTPDELLAAQRDISAKARGNHRQSLWCCSGAGATARGDAAAGAVFFL
jgi:adenylate cyclase